MKRFVQGLTVAVAAASAAAFVYLYDTRTPDAGDLLVQQSLDNPPAAGEHSLRLNTPMDVDLAADSTTLAQLTQREREDQYRDWLLYAAVASLGKPADELGRIFFDLPAVRHGYLRPVGTAEYGMTRSRYVNGGEVMALVPEGRSEAQRKDDLAGIADQHRKNQGGEFKRLLVVEYTLDADRGKARLTRRQDVSYAQLFSPEFGYVEQSIASLDDLQAFASRVDDLTFVRKQPQGLLAGGRKLQRPHRSIGVEQIATVWQAEHKIQANLAEWEAFVKDKEDRFNARWENRRYGTIAERMALEAERDREWELVKAELQTEARQRKPVQGSGFSLDPDFDYAGLRASFDRVWPRLSLVTGSEGGLKEGAAVSEALGRRDAVPLHRLVGDLGRSNHALASMVLRQVIRENSFQAARYDGELQGTEVGMVLFYTDLIAKLWTIDYAGSSPSHRVIRGFLDDPSVQLSLAYQAENDALPSARLWFGPATLGYQLADQGNTLLFGRIATRIFSAGSNPEKPGAETQTSAMLAAAIDWWNDHYEEVADYEPEYQRLNQIMKWSALLGWLTGASEADRLGFLAAVPVDRSRVFPRWIAAHPELRFQQWSRVGFYPAGYKGTTTEALPLLSGPVTEGGVSLANKTLARQPSLATEVDALVRRSNLNYSNIAGQSRLTTLDEVTFTLKGGDAHAYSVLAQAKPGTRLRASGAQLGEAEIESIVSVQRPGTMSLRTRVANAPLGELRIDRVPNGFRVGWLSRDVDQAQMLGQRLSMASDPEATLLRDPTVESFVKFDGEASFAVKLHGSPRWIRMEPEAQARVDLDPAWHLRAAASEDQARRVMQIRLLDDATWSDALKNGHAVVDSDAAGRTTLRWTIEAPANDARMIVAETRHGRVEAWVDSSGAVNLRAPRPNDVLATARSLGSEDLAAIRMAVERGEAGSLKLAASDARSPLSAALDEQNFRAAALHISEDPAAARSLMLRRIASDIKRNGEIRGQRGLAEALHDMDQLIDRHGALPELILRRGMLQLERGNLADASAMASRPLQRPLSDRASFFDEVNARLRRGTPDADGLYRYAQFVEQRDLALRQRSALGELTPRSVDEHFDFDLTLAKSAGETVDRGSRIASDAVVYFEDSAALNRVDWQAPMDQTLLHVIDGRLGKVVRLPDANVANYRPSAIWSPDHKVLYKSARPQTRAELLNTARGGYQACNVDPETGTCGGPRQEQQSGDASRGEVYLVLASR